MLFNKLGIKILKIFFFGLIIFQTGFCEGDFDLTKMNPLNFNDNPEELFENMCSIIEKMSPEERVEFEETSKKISDELEVFVTKESEKMGITPEQYFETEFLKIFDENLTLAKSENMPPGQEVFESDFSFPTAGGPAPKKAESKGKTKKSDDSSKNKSKIESSKKDKPLENSNSTPETETKIAQNSKLGGDNGNWLKKRAFSVEAKKLLDEAKNLLKEIRDKRAAFYSKKMDEIDSSLDNFFQKIGVERGNTAGISEYIETLVGHKINTISTLGKKNSINEDKSDDFIFYQIEDKVDLFKTELSSLKSESDSIGDIDKMASEQINTLDDHIKAAETDFVKMSEIFEKIHETYDDKKANDYYDQIDYYYEQIVAINKHIKETGVKNFEKISELISSSTAKIDEKIKKLNTEVTNILNKLEKTSVKQSSDRGRKNEKPKKEVEQPLTSNNPTFFEKIKSSFFGMTGQKELLT